MKHRLTIDEVLDGFDTSELERLVCSLVAIPSVSGQEKAVMDTALAYLGERGVPVRTLARDPQRPNLVVELGSGRPVLSLNGHLDTVPVASPGSWKTDPFIPIVMGDQIHGLGSLDMKGSCAVMMLTIIQ